LAPAGGRAPILPPGSSETIDETTAAAEAPAFRAGYARGQAYCSALTEDAADRREPSRSA